MGPLLIKPAEMMLFYTGADNPHDPMRMPLMESQWIVVHLSFLPSGLRCFQGDLATLLLG
jgi:hypothetical protein